MAVEAAVKTAVSQITDSGKMNALHRSCGPLVDLSGKLEIHVVGSVCGGTGASILLDLAYDLRRWTRGYNTTIIGHLVLPDAFDGKPVVEEALRANAFAALQEIDWFMNGGVEARWKVISDASQSEFEGGAPFDICYLLGNTNTDIEILTAHMGEFIALSTVNEIGATIASGIQNTTHHRFGSADKFGRACCYSSYGVSVEEIPTQVLGRALGRTMACAVREHMVGRKASQEKLLARLSDLANDLATILKFDTANATVDLFDIVAQIEPAQRKAKRNDFAGAKTTAIEILESMSAKQRHELERWKPKPYWRQEALKEETRSCIRQIFEDGDGGLDSVCRFLETCLEKMKDTRAQLAEAADRQGKDEASNEATYGQAKEDKKADQGIATSLLIPWQAMWKARTAAHVYRAYEVLLTDTIGEFERDFVRKWKDLLDLFTGMQLDEIGEQFDDLAAYGRDSPVPLESLLQDMESDHEAIRKTIVKRLSESVDGWTFEPLLRLEKPFYELCVSVCVEHLAESPLMTCESVLQRHFDTPGAKDDEPKYGARIKTFFERASPSWSQIHGYDRRDNLQEISCVGVVEGARFYETIRDGVPHLQWVRKPDERMIPLIRTAHGMSMAGLRGMVSYEKAFGDCIVREQRWDFHFFLDREWVTEIDFTVPFTGLTPLYQAFSLAEMTGSIVRGERGSYRLKRPDGAKDDPLGANRHEAFKAVLQDDAIMTRLLAELNSIQKTKADLDQEIANWIKILKERVAERILAPAKSAVSRVQVALKHDVFRVHNEIRALNRLTLKDDEGL